MKNRKPNILLTIVILICAGFWVMLLSGNILWTSNVPPLQVIPNMDHTFQAKEQSQAMFFPDRTLRRAPLQYTVPRYAEVYRAESIDEAEVMYAENRAPNSVYVLARGENRYNTYCYPCHGSIGQGDGPIVERGFQKPPSLLEASREFSDARLFHVISKGQNIMPSYANKLKEIDRWAVINYIRKLQNDHPAPVSDVSETSASEEEATE